MLQYMACFLLLLLEFQTLQGTMGQNAISNSTDASISTSAPSNTNASSSTDASVSTSAPSNTNASSSTDASISTSAPSNTNASSSTDASISTSAPSNTNASSSTDSLTESSSATTTVVSTTTFNANVNPSINQICPNNSGVNDKIRNMALQTHNYRRSLLALGHVAKRNGRRMPQAANMMQLTYDCQLEISARDRAQSCSIAENTNPNVQENLRVIRKSAMVDRTEAMRQGVKAWWWKVRRGRPIGVQVTFRATHANKPIRSFTRMAWATTSRIGCAVRSCGDNWHVVCHYNPGANVIGAQIYQKGAPCSACPAGTTCVNALCVA